MSTLARANGVPIATAHRQVATLVAEGFLTRVGHGRHMAGPRLLGLLHCLDEKQIVTCTAEPLLASLASRLGTIVQLGTFENDMVTYRIKAGHGANALFTRIGMQLEAYCSGMGKVLLAHLTDTERAAYLAGGPFVPLTARTITDPAKLAEELAKVRANGFAIDDGEIDDSLFCMAVPLRNAVGEVLAAISVSQNRLTASRIADDQLLPLLQSTARQIEIETFG